MTRRNPLFLVQDVIEFAEIGIAFAAGRQRSDLDSDLQFQFAVVRAIEVAGEAISQVAPLLKLDHPEVAWRRIMGMRNRIVHAYTDVDLNVVWEVLEIDLPALIERFKAIEQELTEQG